MGKIIEIKDDNLKEALEAEKDLVLADFYADWCGPCKMLTPILEEISSEVEDVTIAKVNVDNNSTISRVHGVRNIPTILFFKNGEQVHKTVGVQTKAQLLEMISSNSSEDEQED